MDKKRTDQLFKTLGDANRRQIVRLLGESPLTVGEIVEVMNLPQSTVSRYVKALRSTGLLVDRRQGNRVITALREPQDNGHPELPDLLNQWLRTQSLSDGVRRRLDRVLRDREGTEDTFERLAHQWDELRRRYFGTQFHLEALLALLPHEWHVLDVGTGTGYLLPTLSRQFARVTAVDPSSAMLELARKRAEKEGLANTVFKYGRLESLPVADRSIDAALAILVFHHAENLEDAVSELARVLRPGGRLLVVDLYPHELEDFQRVMGDPIRGLDSEVLFKQISESGMDGLQQRTLPVTVLDEACAPVELAPGMYLIQATKRC